MREERIESREELVAIIRDREFCEKACKQAIEPLACPSRFSIRLVVSTICSSALLFSGVIMGLGVSAISVVDVLIH